MPSSILVLKRGLRVPKQEWRGNSTARTLAPIDIHPVVLRLWRAHRDELSRNGLLEASLELDGSPQEAPVIRAIPERRKVVAGLFDLQYLDPEEVRVTLRGETCWSRLGTPHRRTHPIAALRPWRPVRVLLNGRSSSYSGQYYSLEEYHLALCAEPAPDELQATRLVDLQADLM